MIEVKCVTYVIEAYENGKTVSNKANLEKELSDLLSSGYIISQTIPAEGKYWPILILTRGNLDSAVEDIQLKEANDKINEVTNQVNNLLDEVKHLSFVHNERIKECKAKDEYIKNQDKVIDLKTNEVASLKFKVDNLVSEKQISDNRANDLDEKLQMMTTKCKEYESVINGLLDKYEPKTKKKFLGIF